MRPDGIVQKGGDIVTRETDAEIRGWTILSDSNADALAVIEAAGSYDINHLQLSHHVVHNLKEVRDEGKRRLVTELTEAAHRASISDVLLWDHCLYELDYYPQGFRTGPDGTIDLDNPAFWEWVKEDYRELLRLVPSIQGLLLTFIETGARVEIQHSRELRTKQEKLAAAVNAVADVVVEEHRLKLFVRTFSYNRAEYETVVATIDLFENDKIGLMMKETPHDFFLTHPDNPLPGRIARSTLVEFDTANEFSGQGIIANTWPEHVLVRARELLAREHVIGYVARTDRFGNTRIVGRPPEINLYALKRYCEEPDVTAERIYDEFISMRYGEKSVPHVKKAFKQAFDVVTATLYTLGTNAANHSALDYEPYLSTYIRHISGKWIDPPVVWVRHGVDRDFHYWKDIVNRIAPVWAKHGHDQRDEIPWVYERGWVDMGENIDEEYLQYIITEKDFGVQAAEAAHAALEAGRSVLGPAQYEELHHYLTRTLLTARLYRAAATVYFGLRLYGRGKRHQDADLVSTLRSALRELRETAVDIRDYPVKPPVGEWNWVADAETALRYYRYAAESGWPSHTRGIPNRCAGVTVPLGRG
jgi:hypothetical protein